MKVELDIPDRLLVYLDTERGNLWNSLSNDADDDTLSHPSDAEVILHILDRGRLEM